jgi:D-alanyl-lipoteichoic acid acyltransferase DltB (MBOAT superfamily)
VFLAMGAWHCLAWNFIIYGMTFAFAAGTLFFFANSLDRARAIMRILR